MSRFAYHRPASLAALTELLGQKSDAKLIAGGMTLLPTIRQRLASPSDLVDLSGLDLAGIVEETGGLRIGAMTRHGEVAASPLVGRLIPGLAELAGGIGDPQVRNRGTLGGSIANADPAADYPAALVALGATIVTDRRALAADGFFTGLFETALLADELITAVHFPVPLASAYAKFRNPASRYAMVGVFVARTAAGTRVAVTGAAPSVFRVPAFEHALDREFSPDVLAGMAIEPDGLLTDLHGDADYRAQLVAVMARRAVRAAAR